MSKYYIEQHFLKLYTVTKDEFGGIEISIEDTDPKLAATMTNATVEKIAEIDRRLATANLRAMVDIYEKSLSASTRMIDSSSERINAINRHYKYSSIVMRRELLSQATPGMSADAQLGLLQKAGRLSNDSLATINENFYAVALLDSRRADANSRYIGEYGLYVRAKACLQSDVKTIQVLEHAAVPLIKSRPKRAIIVLAATFITLFFGIVGILLLVQYRGIDWRKIFSELEALPTPAVAKNK